MRAAIVRGDGAGAELVDEAVERAQLEDRLRSTVGRRRRGVEVLVAVASCAPGGRTSLVDRSLVERLIDWLAERGFGSITVGAAGLGYSGRTPSGTPYDVVELADDLVPGDFPPGSALAGASIARAWARADLRLIVVPNATHPEWGHASSLAGLLGSLPASERASRDPGEVLSALLERWPPHFTVVDALRSGHGVSGTDPIRTGTVIASPDAVLAEVVAATLMGLDPAVSPLAAAALHAPGLPEDYEIDGSLETYAGWRNMPALLRETLRAAPPGSPRLLPLALLRAADGNPLLLPTLLGVGGWLAATARSVESWRTMVDKRRVTRRVTSIGFDLDSFADADYDAVAGEVERFEALIDALPPDAWGMRRTTLDGSVLFGCRRTLNAPYEDFIARVDISHAIQFMNDYLGGADVPVTQDEAGRVVRQAERNLYLPQPNYLVLFGAEPIDVCKLETIRYEATEQRICWRTVRSPNGSAAYDDGSVRFRSIDDGARTEIVIHVRQEFTLPLYWQVYDLDLLPEVKDALVADAYRTFFLATLDNFEACYEGREFRIGRPADASDPGWGVSLEGVGQLAGMAKQAVRSAAGRLRPGHRKEPMYVDGAGFQHFAGSDAANPANPAKRLNDAGTKATRAARQAAADLWSTLTYDYRSLWRSGR